MTASPISAREAGQLLLSARSSGNPVPWRTILPADSEGAYAVQDAVMDGLGSVGGWKVGAKGLAGEPTCAPLPASGIVPSGTPLPGMRLRGVEVELALRVRRDFMPDQLSALATSDVFAAFDAILPVMEIVETRLADWHQSAPLARLADLQSHGALVVGSAVTRLIEQIDLQRLEASLAFQGATVVRATGGHPAPDLRWLLSSLIQHCIRRDHPLRKGQVVTTGSCTGMLFAPAGTRVDAELVGLGMVSAQL